VAISRDKSIRRKPAERRAAMHHGVKLFVLTAGGNLTRWDTLDLLVRRWANIGEMARQRGPFVCAVTRGGLRMIDAPAAGS
jgi:hypothetical protein